jgi:hypothetical protein
LKGAKDEGMSGRPLPGDHDTSPDCHPKPLPEVCQAFFRLFSGWLQDFSSSLRLSLWFSIYKQLMKMNQESFRSNQASVPETCARLASSDFKT